MSEHKLSAMDYKYHKYQIKALEKFMTWLRKKGYPEDGEAMISAKEFLQISENALR